MLRLLFIIILTASQIHPNFGQACGAYSIQYEGTLPPGTTGIQLPVVPFLADQWMAPDRPKFVEAERIGRSFQLHSGSNTTSRIAHDPESLIAIFSQNQSALPIILIGPNGPQDLEIPWEQLHIRRVPNRGLPAFVITLPEKFE